MDASFTAGSPKRDDNAQEAEHPRVVDSINILIVDDEPKNLVALETVLEDPGYRLVRAGSGDEALLALVAEEFALLILDIQMPGMNGFELAQIVKQRKKTSAVPIIFLTAFYSEDQHVLEGYSSGAVDYLHKPINANVLRSKVAVFAALHRKTREAAVVNRALTAEIADRRHAQRQLRELNEDLEQRVTARTAELMESESRFRALAEDMPHFVWETDAWGTSTFQNAKWRDYAGVGDAPAGREWLRSVHAADTDATAQAWAAALETGTECDVSCRLRSAQDGQFRWFRIKSAPVRDARGAIRHWVITGTDIHQQRTAEEAMIEADKRKDEFLAMLGHELRNPLSAIRHAVRIQGESASDPASQQWADEVIDRQSAQLTRMVDDLLDVERINRGRIELRPEVLDLKAVLDRAVEAARSMFDAKRHTLNVQAEPELCVRGDAARLQQVFVNLLSNAAKYTPEGGRVHVEARCREGEIVISVTDNGVGLAADVLPRVFDLFTQAHTSIDRAQGGLGIGLTVVKSLVEMHGGTIAARSDGVDRGSTFTVRLPALATSDCQTQRDVHMAATAAAPATRRVLIVDDHRDAGEALAKLLGRRGCQVRTAHDGNEGLAAAIEYQPDVLLLDLGLPGLDGYALCRALRARPEFAHSRLIAISGYAQKGDIDRSLEAGFDAHFAKPVDFGALLEAF